jgi:ABC-type glutathione transport system ATPase component
MSTDAIALDVKQLPVRFVSPTGEIHAVTDAALQGLRGETLALVGEFGGGKLAISHLADASAGQPRTARERRLGPFGQCAAVDLAALNEKQIHDGLGECQTTHPT